jgi:hypothetical protein
MHRLMSSIISSMKALVCKSVYKRQALKKLISAYRGVVSIESTLVSTSYQDVFAQARSSLSV